MIDPQHPDFENTPASVQRPRTWYAPEDAGALPQLSIVTPFHSGAARFHETARCVFAQSLQQWEWILVDDAAPGADAILVLLAEPETQIEAYTNTLAALLPDAERRRALGQRARERVRDATALDATIDAFCGAIDRARSSPGRSVRGRLLNLVEPSVQRAVSFVRPGRRVESPQRDPRLESDAGASAWLASQLLAEQRIAEIEASWSWRLVHGLRHPAIDPQLRLARVEASRSFQLIEALKRTPVYACYARRRWPDWEHPS